MVSQNVTNGITSEVLNAIKKNDVRSTFIRIKSSESPTPITKAILKFLDSYTIKVHDVDYSEKHDTQCLLNFIDRIRSTLVIPFI